MDSPDRRAAVHKLTTILRKTTRYIQWIPFLFLALFSVGSLTEASASENFLCFRDSVISASPLVSAGLLIFSRLLELCRWHKIACVLPLSTPTADYIDNYLFQFTQNEVVAINVTLGILSFVFLVLANHHFFGRKKVKTIKQ
ncbi:MAG: hypothetical protein II661_06200 [Bacteroidales bacterium]|nr:hypothetical protein [Bacteroidales bacterium]